MRQQIYPTITAVIKQMEMINKMFFALLRFLSKTIKPNPALTNSPDVKAPNDKLPSINNSDNNNEEAQFGIRPIIEENNGDRYLFIWINEAKRSSPIKPIVNPNTRLMANT